MCFSQVDLSCKFHKIRGHRGIYPVAWHERLDVCPGRPKEFANIKILSIPVVGPQFVALPLKILWHAFEKQLP